MDGARRGVHRRLNGFDIVLIRIDVASLTLDESGGLTASDDRVARSTLQSGESGGGKLHRVSQHRVGVRTEGAGEAKIRDLFVGEALDHLALTGADVFDVMERSRRHKKH